MIASAWRSAMPRDRRYLLAVWALLVIIFAPIALQVGFLATPGFGSYVVLSGSMAPTLPQSSVVYVYDSGQYEAGDMVTFTRDSSVATHRIVERTSGGYITKGDANNEPDAVVITQDQILGEVVFTVPGYGYLWLFANSQYGAIVILVLGLGTAFFGGRMLFSLYVNGGSCR